MSQRGMTLTGDWTGVYDYSQNAAEPVSFQASLFDVAGVLWGTMQEPNTFAPILETELSADVQGMRMGREVSFRKTYQGNPVGGEEPIDYFGYVSADGTRIEGRWQIGVVGAVFGQPAFGGPFVMTRDEVMVAKDERLAAVGAGALI